MHPALLAALKKFAKQSGKEDPALILARQPEVKTKPIPYWVAK